jgi:CheY-like chemotaxis protein
VAVNGVDALTTLEREASKGPDHEIQCILMDATMDVMDGMVSGRRTSHGCRWPLSGG